MFAFLGIFLISLFGFFVTLRLRKNAGPLERVGLSYLLGIGLYTFIVFLYSIVGIKIDLFSVVVSLALLIFITKKEFKNRIRIKSLFRTFSKTSRTEKWMVGLISLLLMVSFISTLYWPVNEWDALALYDFRAKIIFQTGYFKQVVENYSYFAHYPLLTSLSHTLVYLFGRSNPQFVYSLFYMSFIFVFYGTLRKYNTRKGSLIITLMLASIPTIFVHSTVSYTNLPYTVYFVTGCIYLYIFLLEGKTQTAFLSGLLIGLSTWTRDVEPFWMSAVVILIIYALIKKKVKPLILFLIALFTIQQPWKMYLSSLYGKGRLVTSQVSQAAATMLNNIDIKRYFQIAKFLYEFAISSWGLLLILFILIFTIQVKKDKKHKSILLFSIILLNLFILYAGTYVFSLKYPGWEKIPDSARRMTMFFPPLFLFYIGTTNVFDKMFNKARNIIRLIK